MEQPENMPYILVVQDSCNVLLQGTMFVCESMDDVAAATATINATFPMCPHGRMFAVERGHTQETFREYVEMISAKQGEIMEQRDQVKHKRLMGFIENVREGNMRAYVEGEEIDEFQLASMGDEELNDVAFEVTEKGQDLTKETMRKMGLLPPEEKSDD